MTQVTRFLIVKITVIVGATLLMISACRTPDAKDSSEVLDTTTANQGDLTLVGYVPNRYFPQIGGSGNYALVKMETSGGVIKKMESVRESEAMGMMGQPNTIILKTGSDFDVIYPGLIDLHNHTKQNVMPLWSAAKGQFENRFEWRAWGEYTKALSHNMNPWIGYGKPMTCAAFRWSELMALTLGTTYLQGPSSCVDGWGINQVEDRNSYLTDSGTEQLDTVQAPTDLVVPSDMIFVWKQLKPLIESGQTYSQALMTKLREFCPALLDTHNITDPMTSESVAVFKVKANMEAGCSSDPDKLIRFVYWHHKNVSGKNAYLDQPDRSAFIVHLAEGRREDPYNRIEYRMLELFGLDRPGVNLVHAVGVNAEELREMGQKGIGLVWSPFSNLVLYGETVDIKTAVEANVRIALGSDWTPTGTKSVLEELKIAWAYVQRENLSNLVTPEKLYEMVTENPALMLNHNEKSASDGYHGIGTLAVDAAASLIAVRKSNDDPYLNLIEADTRDINLVVVDGSPLYGEIDYLRAYNRFVSYETMPRYYESINDMFNIPPPPTERSKYKAHLLELGSFPYLHRARYTNNCGFTKGLVAQQSRESDIKQFEIATGLNLDTHEGIQKLLAISLVHQSYNKNPTGNKGNPDYRVQKFPPLYSCNDPDYSKMLQNFVRADGRDTLAEILRDRANRRRTEGHGRKPAAMAEDYGLDYPRFD